MQNPIRSLIRSLRYGTPVVIVSGLPRSGTSMIMKMLHAGGMPILADHERRADVDNPEGYFEHEQVKQLGSELDKSWIRAARGKTLKVISHLVKELPDDNFYRIILARRDILEIVASQNIMLARRGQPQAVADDEAAELYRKHLVHVQMHIASKPNMEVLSVQYSEIVGDPSRCAAQINRFVGGRLDVTRMAAAVDPRLYRNRSSRLATGASLR